MTNYKHDQESSGFLLMSSIVFIVFGLIWTVSAIRMASDAPFGMGIVFIVLGIIFVIVGVVQGVLYFLRAFGKKGLPLFNRGAKEDPDSWIKDETQDN